MARLPQLSFLKRKRIYVQMIKIIKKVVYSKSLELFFDRENFNIKTVICFSNLMKWCCLLRSKQISFFYNKKVLLACPEKKTNWMRNIKLLLASGILQLYHSISWSNFFFVNKTKNKTNTRCLKGKKVVC